MKYFPDRVILLQACDHDLNSHAVKKWGLRSAKQKGAVKRAVRSAPLSVGRQVHDSMLDCNPDKHLPYERRTQSAVGRMVRKTRRDVMAKCIPGVGVDGSEGSMNRLAESLSLSKIIERHNDPDDPFLLEEHQQVCLGYHFDKRCSLLVPLHASPPQQHGALQKLRMAEGGPHRRGLQLVQKGIRHDRLRYGHALQLSVSEHCQLRIQIDIGGCLRCDVCGHALALQRSCIVSQCCLRIMYTAGAGAPPPPPLPPSLPSSPAG